MQQLIAYRVGHFSVCGSVLYGEFTNSAVSRDAFGVHPGHLQVLCAFWALVPHETLVDFTGLLGGVFRLGHIVPR